MQLLLGCLLGRCYRGSSQIIYISKERDQDDGHVIEEQPETVSQKANIRSATFCLSPVKTNDTNSDKSQQMTQADAGCSQMLDRIAETATQPVGRQRRGTGDRGCSPHVWLSNIPSSCSSLLR